MKPRYTSPLLLLLTPTYSLAQSQPSLAPCTGTVGPGRAEPIDRSLANGRLISCVRTVELSEMERCANAEVVTGCAPPGTHDVYELRFATAEEQVVIAGDSSSWSRWPTVTATRHGEFFRFDVTEWSSYLSHERTRRVVVFGNHRALFNEVIQECDDSDNNRFRCGEFTRVTWHGAHTLRVRDSDGTRFVDLDAH